MSDDREIRSRILAKAEEMFTVFGATRVTMEEIATGIGISKKTLYKHFSSKEQLIKTLVEDKKCESGNFISNLLADESLEFIDKLKKLMVFVGEMAKSMRGPMINDLIKSYPDIFNGIKEFRRQKALNQFVKLLEQGVESGIFRKDINQEVVAMIYVSAIHEIIIPEVLSTLPISAEQVFTTIVKILFEGILTEDGRNKYCENSDKKEVLEVK